jgi:tryptophan-rich hypothetical protein
MNQINPQKLLHSKWTAASPVNKEKHFMVVSIKLDDAPINPIVVECVIEAVLTKRQQIIDWQELKDESLWKMGWK